jgi:hypothetical protein
MKLFAVSRFTQNLAYMASCLLHPQCGCIPASELGQISGKRRARHDHRVHLPANSGCRRYTVALLGTTTTFTNSAALAETASVGFAKVRWGFLTGTDQADDWTLAIARLIERIRLADKRMTAPS